MRVPQASARLLLKRVFFSPLPVGRFNADPRAACPRPHLVGIFIPGTYFRVFCFILTVSVERSQQKFGGIVGRESRRLHACRHVRQKGESIFIE